MVRGFGLLKRYLNRLLVVAPVVLTGLLLSPPVCGDPPAAGEAEKIGKLPNVTFSVQKKQVRVECQALAVDAPLEFFCVLAGTSEHEAVLRTAAKPSDIHTALLALGLKPGAPLTYFEATKKWLPPSGPPLHISVEFEKDGKVISYPANRWIRDVKTKKEAKPFTWVFCGSRVTKDNRYAADDTGYVVSLVNFDFTLIDIPELASNSNEALEWERNAGIMPAKGTTVYMVIEPAGKEINPGVGVPATQPAAAAQPGAAVEPAPALTPPNPAVTDVKLDEKKIQDLLKFHEKMVGPQAEAIRRAAQAHYDVINALRKEQQRLITEADVLQRAIDELEKKYQDLTTPAPTPEPGVPAQQ